MGKRGNSGAFLDGRDDEAFRLFTEAANLGCAAGQYGLGGCYSTGTGVKKDRKEAVRWYRMAAWSKSIPASPWIVSAGASNIRNAEQLQIVSAIGRGETHIDDIIETTNLSAAKVLSQLTILEIKGYVRRAAGRRVVLNVTKK